jgi:antitoxin (DNA-binding transcriptional repressor) of toxin-antitoxin stability system
MTTITLEEAQANLPELIEHLGLGQELVITRDARPVAMLVRPASQSPQPLFGRGRGKAVVVSDDDEHLIDFEEYMP